MVLRKLLSPGYILWSRAWLLCMSIQILPLVLLTLVDHLHFRATLAPFLKDHLILVMALMALVLHIIMVVILVISLMVLMLFHLVLMVIMEGDFIILTIFDQGVMVAIILGSIIPGLVLLGNLGLGILLTDMSRFQSLKFVLKMVILLLHVSIEMILEMVRLFKSVRCMEKKDILHSIAGIEQTILIKEINHLIL